MISVLHLLWIIPISVVLGGFIFALIAANRDDD